MATDCQLALTLWSCHLDKEEQHCNKKIASPARNVDNLFASSSHNPNTPDKPMNKPILYPANSGFLSKREEISRYYRRSDAILKELQYASSCGDGPEERVSFLDTQQQYASPLPLLLIQGEVVPRHPLSTVEENGEDCFNPTTFSEIALTIAELRVEGARNPFDEEDDTTIPAEISEATQQFLQQFRLLGGATNSTNSSSPPPSSWIQKPIPLRATDVISSSPLQK